MVAAQLRVGRDRAAPGVFRWGSIDKIMRQAPHPNAVAVLAMVGTTPSWAAPAGCSELWCQAAGSTRTSAGFAAAIARRYRVVGHPGLGDLERAEPLAGFRQRPGPDAERYGRLLVAAATAIRAEDPDATVLSGGLAPALTDNERHQLPDRFLDELYDTGAMQAVDGVAYHPYSYPNLPSVRTGQNGFIDQLEAVRDVMVEHGDEDGLVWLTEFGMPTPGGGSPLLARQEKMVVDGFETWRSLDYVGPLFWFSWRDSDTGSDGAHLNFGLRRSDDSPKPGLRGLRARGRAVSERSERIRQYGLSGCGACGAASASLVRRPGTS